MASNKAIIFVTGASSGIGYETVLELSKESTDFHILLGARTIEKGDKALGDINSAAGSLLKASISVLPIEITDQESVDAAKGSIEARYGKLDILINNAGIVVYQDVDRVTAFRQSFETNVIGSMRVTETLEPLLKKSSKPLVIYVSSEQGSISLRLNPDHQFHRIQGDAYRTSKAALNMVAACQRYNYADAGIKVVAFNPGWCLSNLTGEQGREWRIKGGARDPKEPAVALVEIVNGKRDIDIENNGLVHVDGGVLPW
ncbi:putative short chain dehydrogenase/reductase [Fusarium redolens]|uniref:Short chain dehydrogenase/reductase n=1 Tax=Fusarium redolens TaxID=48865 RepID=A0A9P9GU72_FUSRE|nr:putative short chain dehydrogenase/reductase [Fusarium redolens]KAH7244584.1 putative short chain dehydrogenase/reductase [Fusarium redolens]